MNDRSGLTSTGLSPGQGSAQLVIDVSRFLSECRQMSGSGAWSSAHAADLHRGSTALQARAHGLGLGGIANRLAACMAFIPLGGPPDPPTATALVDALAVVFELAWQVTQGLTSEDRAMVESVLSAPAPSKAVGLGEASPAAAHGGPRPPSDLAPPPMLTIFPSTHPAAAGSSSVPTRPGHLPSPLGNEAPSKARSASDPLPPAAVPLPAMITIVKPNHHTPGQPGALPPIKSAPGSSHVGGPPAPVGLGHPPALPPRESSEAGVPKLLVRSMLGLSAFGHKSGDANVIAKPVPQRDGVDPAVLGLRRRTSSPPAPPEGLPSVLPSGPRSSVPRSRSDPPKAAHVPRPTPAALLGAAEVSTRPRQGGKSRRRLSRDRKGAATLPWWWIAGAGLAVFAIALVFAVSRVRRGSIETAAAPSAAPSDSATPASEPAPPALRGSRLLNDDERFRALVAQVHGRGGTESPELRALVDEQASLRSKLLAEKTCEADPTTCAALSKERQLLGDPTSKVSAKRRAAGTPTALRPKWMAGLAMPDIPVADDTRVERVFEYFSDNQVGRERFQAMLFRCGAYRDVIQATLIRYDVPPSLLAVVFAESGCDAVAKSAVGARGLWQFMPDAGRAYHLRIIEAALDERLSPPKETEAAIHFLADLYGKFGAWDCAFAAYNMGPFGLLARLSRAEPGVGFWDLADAGLLPDETANYVPTIEAFALILANLQKLKFAGTQMRSPEVTADLDVAPGTRLGLVARSASTNVVQIRALNLDVISDRVPSVPGERFAIQVPKDVVWQARETLEGLLAQGNHEDECVPDTFDWGKQRFTPEMSVDCRKRLGTAAGGPPP